MSGRFEVPARTESVQEVANGSPATLFGPPAKPKGLPVGPGRTAATSSWLLYEAIGKTYDGLGFHAVGDEVFRDLVIARIVEPTSKLDSLRVLNDLGANTVSYRTIQRHLRSIVTDKYRDVITKKCFAHSRDRGTLSLLLYDVTTLYFEAENEDDLRKVGYSKERRVDPQIVVGLLVDRTGFPLEISCFEGNTTETTTIVPILQAFQKRHDLAGVPMVVAADAGMLSWTNLKALNAAGFSFIVGSRATKAPGDLASHFRWHGNAFTDGQVIDTVTPRRGATVVNNTKLKAEPVWTAAEHPKAWRAIWQYKAARARRDQKTLDAQEARAKEVIAGEKKAKATRSNEVMAQPFSLMSAATSAVRSLLRGGDPSRPGCSCLRILIPAQRESRCPCRESDSVHFCPRTSADRSGGDSRSGACRRWAAVGMGTVAQWHLPKLVHRPVRLQHRDVHARRGGPMVLGGKAQQ